MHGEGKGALSTKDRDGELSWDTVHSSDLSDFLSTNSMCYVREGQTKSAVALNIFLYSLPSVTLPRPHYVLLEHIPSSPLSLP